MSSLIDEMHSDITVDSSLEGMSTKTQSTPRFSRLGLGFGLKLHSPLSPTTEKRLENDEEDWYIPYNGPYEVPNDTPRRPKERDSWGDPIEDDAVLDDQELRDRYGGESIDFEREDRKMRTRERAVSAVSGRTMSSGTVDPSTVRRNSNANHTRHPVPSYINLDAAGGVGEAPVPLERTSHPYSPASNGRRASLASIFTFGRKFPSSPGKFPPELVRSNSMSSTKGASSRMSRPDRPTSPTETPSLRETEQTKASIPERESAATEDEDYYNSYYSTLLSTPGKGNTRPQDFSAAQPRPALLRSSPEPWSPSRPQSATPHPYAAAYVFPSAALSTVEIPSPTLQPLDTRFNEPGPSDYQYQNPSQATPPMNPVSALPGGHFTLPHTRSHLKASISTPNLRTAPRRAPKHKVFDRWLSPETWCDALLFPRPRLKVKQDRDHDGAAKRAPESPLRRGTVGDDASPSWPRRNGMDSPNLHVPSRTLDHSISLSELRRPTNSTAVPASPLIETIPRDHTTTQDQSPVSLGKVPERNDDDNDNGARLRPLRPKSFAWDDLALPSPVPSLARCVKYHFFSNHIRLTPSFQRLARRADA